MPLPTVSILLLTYNHAEFIAQCLDSILAQRREGFALTVHVADDASTDKTGDIVAAYAQKYPHIIQHHRNPKNMGATPSHHHHLRQIKSDYYILLEGDDYFLGSEKLAVQIAFLEANKDYVGCCHDTVFVGNEEKSIYTHALPEVLTARDFASGRYHVHTSSMIWRNIYMGELPIEHNELRGDVFNNIVHAAEGDVYIFPQKWSAYRIHTGGVTGGGRNKPDMISHNIRVSFNTIKVYRDLFAPRFKHEFKEFLLLRALVVMKYELLQRRRMVDVWPYVLFVMKNIFSRAGVRLIWFRLFKYKRAA